MENDGAPRRHRAFVIRDFTIPSISIALERLAELKPAGYEEVVVSGVGKAIRFGEIGRDAVLPAIDAASRVLALVDLPNANVGFEIGYAASKGKAAALVAALAEVPAWLQRPPLNGFLVLPGSKLEELVAILEHPGWVDVPHEEPAPGPDILFLCPDAGNGSTLRGEVERSYPGWRVLTPGAWSLKDLPAKLRGVGTVVWTIAQHPEGSDQRDGKENAAAGVVAGFAFARGAQLRVLREKGAREVADVQPFEEEAFERLTEFRSRLASIATPPARRGTVDPLTAYRDYLRRHHACLAPLFAGKGPGALDDVFVELELAADLGREKGPLEASTRPERGERLSLRALMECTTTDNGAAGRWVVLGEPGAGKSTLARHLVWELAAEEGPIPIYLSLPQYARDREHPFRVADRLVAAGRRMQEGALEDALVERARQPGGIWIFLDGLDEVSSEHRERLRSQLTALLDGLEHGVICVLSRPIGFESPGASFRQARVSPLAPETQRRLLERWIGAERALKVWERIQDRPALEKLTSTPLLLALYASLAREALAKDAVDLPPSRTGLYAQTITNFLRRGFGFEDDRHGVRDPVAAQRALEELSLVLQSGDAAAWAKEELDESLWQARKEDDELKDRLSGWPSHDAFLDDVAKNSGILGPHDGSNAPWRFFHRQFREFLAAGALKRRGETHLLELVSRLDQSALGHWGETLGLACGLVEKPLELLGKLRDLNAPLALRALPEVDRLDADEAMDFLVTTPRWDAGDLERLLLGEGIGSKGGRERAVDRLWKHVSPKRSTKELAYLHFSIEWLRGTSTGSGSSRLAAGGPWTASRGSTSSTFRAEASRWAHRSRRWLAPSRSAFIR